MMNNYTGKSQENKGRSVANNLPKNGKPSLSFALEPSEATAQQQLQDSIDNSPQVKQLRAYQQMANQSLQRSQAPAKPPVQRKPECAVLSVDEETAITLDVKASKWQDAIDKVMATAVISSDLPPNLGTVTYDKDNKNFGIAEQDADDPATKNTVDIKIGPLAFRSISVLVSTVSHELVHAKQHTQASKSADDIGDASWVYGYAKEKSGYIEAAQEIHAYCMEIHNAAKTGISADKEYLTSRGINMSNYWYALYNAGKSGKSSSKPAKYMAKMKPFVEKSYNDLKNLGIDISSYDKRGLSLD